MQYSQHRYADLLITLSCVVYEIEFCGRFLSTTCYVDFRPRNTQTGCCFMLRFEMDNKVAVGSVCFSRFSKISDAVDAIIPKDILGPTIDVVGARMERITNITWNSTGALWVATSGAIHRMPLCMRVENVCTKLMQRIIVGHIGYIFIRILASWFGLHFIQHTHVPRRCT